MIRRLRLFLHKHLSTLARRVHPDYADRKEGWKQFVNDVVHDQLLYGTSYIRVDMWADGGRIDSNILDKKVSA